MKQVKSFATWQNEKSAIRAYQTAMAIQLQSQLQAHELHEIRCSVAVASRMISVLEKYAARKENHDEMIELLEMLANRIEDALQQDELAQKLRTA